MTPIRDPWSVLDLDPGAPHDEILKAYLRLRRALRADSPALLSLECEAARRSELAAVEEAFRSLSRNAAAPIAAGPSTPSRLATTRPARRSGPRRISVPLDRLVTGPTIRL
jgi:hypothetical protein